MLIPVLTFATKRRILEIEGAPGFVQQQLFA